MVTALPNKYQDQEPKSRPHSRSAGFDNPDSREWVSDMNDISKEELKQAIKEALEEYSEVTFGINSTDADERARLRDDMTFLRHLRSSAAAGGEKIILVIVGVFGTVALTWILRNVWPDGEKYLK